jgi:hypothetical protein
MTDAWREYWRDSYYIRRHHERFVRYVEAMPRKLICQDCGGAGGEIEVVLDFGEGPWEECGWCEGTGLVTPFLRGMWLAYKRKAA